MIQTKELRQFGHKTFLRLQSLEKSRKYDSCYRTRGCSEPGSAGGLCVFCVPTDCSISPVSVGCALRMSFADYFSVCITGCKAWLHIQELE